jgi:hypothetical protein
MTMNANKGLKILGTNGRVIKYNKMAAHLNAAILTGLMDIFYLMLCCIFLGCFLLCQLLF